MEQFEFDVFLAHNSKDKPQVRAIAQELTRYNLRPWFDEEQIFPGDNIQQVVSQGISRSKVGAFFISQNGLGTFQENLELGAIIQFFLRKHNQQGFRVIPILLGINDIPDSLFYLSQWAWIQFSSSNDEAALKRLIRGIRGRGAEVQAQPTIQIPDTPLIIEPKPPQTDQGLSLQTFRFETVTVNPQGNITNRRHCEAKYFVEDLGNGVTLEMVQIPGGKFIMGSPAGEAKRRDNESPQHEVTVPSFFMGKYEVTQAQYQAIMGNNPSYFKGEKRPVETVSWNDAVEFCKRLSEKTERTYRLPSEAEWEYAARAGTTTPFYFGETITTDLANYNGNYTYGSAPKGEYRQQTTDVGKFPPNTFGLYDMCGNVFEWCLDKYHNNYDGAPTDGSAWLEGSENYILLRGGSWDFNPGLCRCANRDLGYPDGRRYDVGFRLVVLVA
ncbi:MAG: serine/threonine-protein kinase pkn1 [Hapalosiphonaceae cyanobacterium JJU2]|nr:MAG: serine/threonine-protein kinase pkn1 [Hapalosiphonaceae cyanobacterium JJU2]